MSTCMHTRSIPLTATSTSSHGLGSKAPWLILFSSSEDLSWIHLCYSCREGVGILYVLICVWVGNEKGNLHQETARRVLAAACLEVHCECTYTCICSICGTTHPASVADHTLTHHNSSINISSPVYSATIPCSPAAIAGVHAPPKFRPRVPQLNI